jgi:hypothetical protein
LKERSNGKRTGKIDEKEENILFKKKNPFNISTHD